MTSAGFQKEQRGKGRRELEYFQSCFDPSHTCYSKIFCPLKMYKTASTKNLRLTWLKIVSKVKIQSGISSIF